MDPTCSRPISRSPQLDSAGVEALRGRAFFSVAISTRTGLQSAHPMKRLLPIVLAVSLISALPVTASVRLDAKIWNTLRTYDVRTLSKNFDSHVGELAAIKFNFRGKDIHHLKPNWYEGSLWQPDPKGKKGFSNVRIMVSKKDLDAFKSITTDSTSGAEVTVYGRVLRDADANFVFVRLLGRNSVVDPSGNAVVSW
jgi:hypothetical protein